jgi:hypothetical protein
MDWDPAPLSSTSPDIGAFIWDDQPRGRGEEGLYTASGNAPNRPIRAQGCRRMAKAPETD